MIGKSNLWAEVDEEGRLVLPPEAVARYGLEPGARVRVDTEENSVRLHRPVTHLTKIYVEPTNRCNLACRTCIRNEWDAPQGRMREETFAAILESAIGLDPVPTIFFGGLGEPLFNPSTIDWIAQAKAAGARVEMITNGTLLDESRARRIIAAGLDLLWVSIDGATPECYSDVRLGAQLPQVLENVRLLRRLRPGSHHPRPEIGIAFVAMKRNIDDLPAVLKLGRSLGAKHFSVSNVLPHTEEMREEILYPRTLRTVGYLDSPWHAHLDLPRLDLDDTTKDAFFQALNSDYNITFAGNRLGGASDVCSFIESGTITVGWDGAVSPCIPLLYDHTSYLREWKRASHRHVLGYVDETDLLDLWLEPEYVAYRERVHNFAFAPCTFCGGCELLESNDTDCFDNPFPACGACLWAQGIVQCP